VILLVVIGVKRSETEWMIYDILHGSQSTLDLALQIGVHKETCNNARNENLEFIGYDNCWQEDSHHQQEIL
jgi:hypothetical protein